MGYTRNFGFKTGGAGFEFAEDGYKFIGADRETIDLLFRLLFEHDHAGNPYELLETPADPPGLDLDPESDPGDPPIYGTLPAATSLYYVYTLVSPEGVESAGSPEATIDTPDPVATPGAPTLARGNTGGTLRPGGYFYKLSAYRDATTLETVAGLAASTTLPNTGSTQRLVLTLPALPPDADGFNIYRRIPGSTEYHHLASIDAAAVAAGFTDIGDEADCERLAPTRNTTGEANAVGILIPAELPEGYTWRIYRSLDPGEWNGTFLANVVEETTEGSGITTDYFIDTGEQTADGSPPLTTPELPTIPPAVAAIPRLRDLTDVDMPSPPDSDGMVPVWSDDDQVWRAGIPATGPSAFASLTDVDVSLIAPGDTVVWDGEFWVPALPGVGALASLTDVDLTVPPVDGQALVWDDAAGKWVAGAGGGADGASAYQIWLDAGNSGDEAAFLASLRQLPSAITRNDTGTGNYTLVLDDAGKVVIIGSGDITIPTNASVAVPVDTVLNVYCTDADVEILAASGVTIEAPTGAKAGGAYATISLWKRATNTWVVSGWTVA